MEEKEIQKERKQEQRAPGATRLRRVPGADKNEGLQHPTATLHSAQGGPWDKLFLAVLSRQRANEKQMNL